jgi:hypothetical protein
MWAFEVPVPVCAHSISLCIWRFSPGVDKVWYLFILLLVLLFYFIFCVLDSFSTLYEILSE